MSCKTAQPLTENVDKPQWVLSRPQSSGNYIGIGAAPKKGTTPAAYMSSAKKNALSDLSSEISINIESTSMLNSMQINQTFSQQFVNDIKTNNELFLEGYELVDTYEDESYYWVYYRLSKEGYQAWKEQQKQQAIAVAENKYLQAENLLQKQMHNNAFQLYAEALSAISSYLNESTLCTLNQQEVDLGNTIYNAMLELIHGAHFLSESQDISIKKNVKIPNDAFCFLLEDAIRQEMGNMPVKVSFTGTGLMKSTEKTNEKGRVCCSLPQIKTTQDKETLSLSVDMVALSRLATNHLVRSIIKNISANEMQIRIIIQKPSLQIISNESVLNAKATSAILKEHFSNRLFTIFDVNDAPSSDFVLSIQSNTIQKDQYNKLYYIDMETTISLTDSKGQQKYRKHIKEEFSGNTYKAASQNGYQEVIKLFDRSIQHEIERSIN